MMVASRDRPFLRGEGESRGSVLWTIVSTNVEYG
jgi:hypothetical protein